LFPVENESIEDVHEAWGNYNIGGDSASKVSTGIRFANR